MEIFQVWPHQIHNHEILLAIVAIAIKLWKANRFDSLIG